MPIHTDNPVMGRGASRSAFTLVELLVVMGIIGVLLAVILAATSSAISSSRAANTTRLLGSIASAIDSFEADHRFIPPLLMENPENGGSLTLAIRLAMLLKPLKNIPSLMERPLRSG